MPYKRKGSDRWQITVSGIRQSSGTSDYHRAKTLEHKLNHEAWDTKRLGVKFRTWDEACLDWFKRKVAMKSLEVYGGYAKFWREHFSGKPLKYVTGALARQIMIDAGKVNAEVAVPANTTANHKLAFVGKIVRNGGMAFECDYFPAPQGREEWLSLEQWRSLVMPDDIRRLATFSLATGLREANVIGLPWEWVKGDHLLVPAAFAKTARPYGIPLNKTALAMIEERRSIAERDAEEIRRMAVVPIERAERARMVFWLHGRPAYRVQIQRAWNPVLRAAGVPHMPYHGLRHTFASWMVQAAVPFEIVARLGQWKQRGMVHRYSHFDVESLRPWAERIDTILAQPVRKSLQNKAV